MDKQKIQDIIIKVCCLIAALVLWMYVRVNENPMITSTIKYVPVQVLNADSLTERDMVLIPDQQFYINISVKGSNSSVSDIDKNKDFKLVADLDGYALTPGENKVKVTVKDAPVGITIVNSDALTLKIDVDTLEKKDFNISTNVTGEVAEGYYNDNNIASPDKVTVEGPARYVDIVTQVVADIDISSASEDFTKNYKLKALDEKGKEVSGVSIYPESVQIRSEISKGRFLPINVVTTGSIKSGLSVVSITPAIQNLEVVGEKDTIDKFTEINTTAINLNEITESKTVKLSLNMPEGVYAVDGVDSIDVNIVIKKSVEKTFTVAIQYSNLGEGMAVNNPVSEVQVTLSGEESAINAIKGEDLKAAVDLSNQTIGKHSLDINVTGIPSGVEIKSQSPQSVEVNLTAANEETKKNDNQG